MSTQNTSIQESVVKPTNEETTEIDSATKDTELKQSPYMKKKRKLVSDVWIGFKEVTDKKGDSKYQCIYCKKLLSKCKGNTTTHLSRHLKCCPLAKPKNNDSISGQSNLCINTSISQSETITSVQNFKYSQAKVREVLSHMIIVHELPFRFSEYELFSFLMKTATPYYEKISRATVKKDCITTFELQKKKLMTELKGVDRLSLTTDLWKSGQNISYMVVTCHFVDSDWNLQKRTLNFCDIPPPHSGLAICDVLNKCLVEWEIEKKVWTVTVDNATANDVAIRTLKENLSYSHTLPLQGEIFHVRCCAHILNIMVKTGLSAIEDIISTVRESVKFIAASEGRTIMFSDIAAQLKLSSKKLVLDCCTRWNATYYMLSAALEFRDVFPRYQQRDLSYSSLPSVEDWNRVQAVCSFLQKFEELTKLISGSDYPTANLFLTELVQIKKLLRIETQDAFMKEVIENMNAKFEKYWGNGNLLICIAAVLDPRNKMKVIKWCAKNTMSEARGVELVVKVREKLYQLYEEYENVSKLNDGESSTTEPLLEESSTHITLEQKSRHDFESYMSDDDCMVNNSALDFYLDEPVVKWKEPTPFDAIMWWKMNNAKYKVLSKMACDVLSIPITSVASESAFSAGGRVIDSHRASLGTNTVEMLLCTGDWLRAFYQIKGKARKADEDEHEKDIQEISLALEKTPSFVSGIGNWMADEVLYQARIHPLLTASSLSKESCATLLKCINEVTERALEVGADSSQFPNNWIFHSREKKPGKAFVDGKKIDFIKAGGRTTAYVPELQKLIDNQAVKGTGKRSQRTSAGKGSSIDESGSEDEPAEPKVVKGRKTSSARKPPSKKKSNASVEHSDGDDNEDDNGGDDVPPSKRQKGAKKPPAKSKPKGEKNGDSQRRQTRGKGASAKRKHEESDDDLSNSSGNGAEEEA